MPRHTSEKLGLTVCGQFPAGGDIPEVGLGIDAPALNPPHDGDQPAAGKGQADARPGRVDGPHLATGGGVPQEIGRASCRESDWSSDVCSSDLCQDPPLRSSVSLYVASSRPVATSQRWVLALTPPP